MIAVGFVVLVLALLVIRLDISHSYPYWLDAMLALIMFVAGLSILGGIGFWLWENAP